VSNQCRPLARCLTFLGGRAGWDWDRRRSSDDQLVDRGQLARNTSRDRAGNNPDRRAVTRRWGGHLWKRGGPIIIDSGRNLKNITFDTANVSAFRPGDPVTVNP